MGITRRAYGVLAEMWNGLRNGLDAFGPAGTLAATASVILVVYVLSGGNA